MHTFALNTEQHTVQLDGHEIADSLSAVEVYAEAGAPGPEVVLRLTAAHTLDITGLAEVGVEVEDTVACIRRFLAGIDPKKLESQALDRHAGDRSLTELMLEVLGEWASET